MCDMCIYTPKYRIMHTSNVGIIYSVQVLGTSSISEYETNKFSRYLPIYLKKKKKHFDLYFHEKVFIPTYTQIGIVGNKL